LDLEVCPEDVSFWILVLKLMNKDLLVIGGQGAVEDGVTTETPPPPPPKFTIQRLSEVFKGTESAFRISMKR
jgi:hypothetical protein